MSEKIRIHLADDHQVLIDGMLAVLKTNSKFEVVGHSLNGLELVDKIQSNEADILIMDINMPHKDGIEVLKELSQTKHSCRVIILSSYDDIKLIKEVLKLGANGYLSKQCAGESIVEAIESVAAGKDYFSQNIQEKIVSSFSGNGTEPSTNEVSINTNLTDRELEILKLISLEYSGKEIGEELSISLNTVETHRKNLIKKLNVKNTIGIVKFAIKNNLIKQ
ncbi:response regulator transcription factor [Flavobacterium piscinae]|uniref:Response regulator transcription factor n=1 Tax=Flavobacterium piscinae TaxID=2506424 RepID=A0A4Q1KNV8_9FLAO|nr:response regulator transcription factor [Flavobacterium piscinae]RXR31743.1 response regulator transcription factor [Flavobacterium piscinae]